MSASEYKEKLLSFFEKHKRMPGYKEMMVLFGFKSKNAVYKLINKFVEEGIVNKDARGKLTPTTLFDEIPVLGLVEAGFPTIIDEDRSETMSIDEYLIDNKAASYVLEVKGDSMIDAGIHEGDLVIVERSKPPRVGDIVIAEVDGAWTMKYYRLKGNRPYLEPANKDYEDIYPEYQLNIAAVVKAVIRKY